MHVATQWCNDRLVGKLIAAGGNVNATDSRGCTPCHWFQKAKDPRGDGAARSMALLIAANADVNAVDEDGNTPLHCLAQVGFSDCVSLLLKAGANVHARNKLDRTPLHVVTNVDSAALLVGAKADLNALDVDGCTACHCASASTQLLLYLVGAGADVRVKDNNGMTVLHATAFEGFGDALSRLIDAGLDVNLGDNDGNCAGHLAACAGRVDNLKRLLEHGAEIERRNNAGKTMFLLAASAEVHPCFSMRVLIDAGADTSVIDDSLAFSASPSALPLLRSLGMNLNCVDDRGNTPCHLAADTETLVALFALGATMTAKNHEGMTPYENCRDIYNAFEHDDAVLTFVAAGLAFGVQTLLRSSDIAAVVNAGGGFVSAKADSDAVDLWRHERALRLILARQKQLFRARALQVCVGLQSLRLSALEMCEILTNMFSPLESMVPFHFVWRVVCCVKHFSKHQE
jgi:ankyrin repeat protein